jgi:nucleoside-triphosphatase THEP1
MNAVITGAIGSGKTTVCRKLVSIARERGRTCGGVLTTRAAGGYLFVQDLLTGARAVLAGRLGAYTGPSTEKFSFNPEGIRFGLGAIARGMAADLVVVDELGPLELDGQGFAPAVARIASREYGDLICVVRRELVWAFLPLLGENALVFVVTQDNRNALPGMAAERLSLRPLMAAHV